MNHNKHNKTAYYLLTLGAIIIPVILALFYVYFHAVILIKDLKVNGTPANKFEINLVTENNGYINASNVSFTKSENIAQESQKSFFKIVSGNNKHYITYDLSLSELTISSSLQVENFKWQLVKDNQIINSGNFNGVNFNGINLATDLIIGVNKTHEYELRIWLQETEYNQSNLKNGIFSGKITLIADKNQKPVWLTLKDLILDQEDGSLAIEAKGPANFSKISPIVNGITNYYEDSDTYNIPKDENKFPSNNNKAIGTGYIFNESTGLFSLVNYTLNNTFSSNHINQYTCNGDNIYQDCQGIMQIKAVSGNKITKITDIYHMPIYKIDPSTTGLYAAEDEYGISYYYRGSRKHLNNNLIFAGFQWKIIRINGDGTIRLIYNGSETDLFQKKQCIPKA